MSVPYLRCGRNWLGCLAVGVLLSVFASPVTASAAELEVKGGRGAAGEQVRLEVVLHTEGETIAAVENEIVFDRLLPIAGDILQRPVCAVNSEIGKDSTAFAFLPPGCGPGGGCERVKAIVLDLGNLDPIPDGSVLYSCIARLSSGVEVGTSYGWNCANARASGPRGERVGLTCRGGEVLAIGLPPPRSQPPTPTRPTRTPTSTAAATRDPRLPTFTPAPIQVGIPGGGAPVPAGDQLLFLLGRRVAGVGETIAFRINVGDKDGRSVGGARVEVAAAAGLRITGVPGFTDAEGNLHGAVTTIRTGAWRIGAHVTLPNGGQLRAARSIVVVGEPPDRDPAPSAAGPDDDGCQVSPASGTGAAWFLFIPVMLVGRAASGCRRRGQGVCDKFVGRVDPLPE